MLTIPFSSIRSGLLGKPFSMIITDTDAGPLLFAVRHFTLSVHGVSRRLYRGDTRVPDDRWLENCTPKIIADQMERSISDNEHMGELTRWNIARVTAFEVTGARTSIRGLSTRARLANASFASDQQDEGYVSTRLDRPRLLSIGDRCVDRPVPICAWLTLEIKIPGGAP